MRQEPDEPDEVVRHLLLRQRELEARLARVEDSVIFRMLRWFGRPARQWLKRGAAGEHAAAAEYARWVQQSVWLRPAPGECARKRAGWRRPVSFSYFLHGSADGPPVHPSSEILRFEGAESWKRAICQARGEYAAILPSDVVLSPVAEYRWGEALQRTDAEAIYSDWDHINAAGARHAPRFTPELSPALLGGTPYWGNSFLVRTALLRSAGADLDPSGPGWAHVLARRLAESTGAIVRIPEILWHRAGPVEPIESGHAGSLRGDPSQASIVICSRTPRLLENCLRSLRQSDAALAEIIVVVHACGTERRLEEIARSGGARSVRYAGQFHFGFMSALGVEQSTRPVLVFLNDDVEPIGREWLGALLDPLSRGIAGIAGGLLLYPNGTVQHSGISVGMRTAPAHLGRGQMSSPWWPWMRMTREVSAVTGACLAMRRSVWDELDGFDRRFPVNYNDVDLCLRAGRAGYSVVLSGGAVLHHHEGRTRAAVVTSAESTLFSSLWMRSLSSPDPFFSPNLTAPEEAIELAPPFPAV